MVDPPGLASLALVTAEWLALGWLAGARFPGHEAPLANAGLRVLVGASLTAFAQLGLAAVGLGVGRVVVVLLAAALVAFAIRRLAGGRCCAGELLARESSKVQHLGYLLLGAVLLAALVRSLVVPEAGWDAYSHWGLRAQAFALAGTIVDAGSEHEYYPPLVPLLEAWLYMHRGQVSIDLAKTLWAVVGIAFSLCLTWHLRFLVRPAIAPYAAVGIVLATPMLLEGFWTGQADLALTAFLTLATLAAVRHAQTGERLWLTQLVIWAAAAALTKFEGAPRVGVLAAAVVLEGLLVRDRQVWRPALALVAAALVASAAWTAYALGHGIAPNAEHIGPFQPLALGGVLTGLLAAFGGVRSGGGVTVAALGWLASLDALLRPPVRLLAMVVAAQLAATLLGFLFSATPAEVEVRTSATRLFEQFMPLALVAAAAGLGRMCTYNRGGR